MEPARRPVEVVDVVHLAVRRERLLPARGEGHLVHGDGVLGGGGAAVDGGVLLGTAGVQGLAGVGPLRRLAEVAGTRETVDS